MGFCGDLSMKNDGFFMVIWCELFGFCGEDLMGFFNGIDEDF